MRHSGNAFSRVVIALSFSSIAACATVVPPPVEEEPTPQDEPAPKITSSEQLIHEMHDKYAGNWYRTLRFAQTNTFYGQSGKETISRWVENLSVPGRLRIDFEPLTSKSGLLILNNRVTTFDNGKRVDSRRAIQPILTLTADVYAIPAEITIRRLDSLKFDLGKFRSDKLDKKRVYVVGADEGDLESNQVWVDAEQLLLVRLIQQDKRDDRTIVTDTRVGEYRDIDGYPVAHEFMSTRDGKPYFKEVYEDVRVNAELPEGIFDPSRWASVQPDATTD